MRPDDADLSPPTIGLAGTAYFLPEERRPLESWARAVGPSALALLPTMQANGLASYRVAPDMDIEDLCVAATARLFQTSALAPRDVDLVLYCHTNTTSVMATPATIPAVLKQRFGLDRAIGYSVAQQNCACIVLALRLLRTLMWRDPTLRNVVIVSADKVFGEHSRNVSSYAIQSDGALALWVRRGETRNRVGPISYHIDGRYYRGSRKGPELAQRFALNYAILAHQMIADVMREAGWSRDDVDAVLPMNANLSAFSKVIGLLGLPLDRLHTENIGRVGHVFCCDPFINFIDRFADPARIRHGNAILFASSSSGVFCAVGIDNAWTGSGERPPRPGEPGPTAHPQLLETQS